MIHTQTGVTQFATGRKAAFCSPAHAGSAGLKALQSSQRLECSVLQLFFSVFVVDTGSNGGEGGSAIINIIY